MNNSAQTEPTFDKSIPCHLASDDLPKATLGLDVPSGIGLSATADSLVIPDIIVELYYLEHSRWLI